MTFRTDITMFDRIASSFAAREGRRRVTAGSKPISVAAGRLACLDAYRGFVILMMIWVNYLASMPGIPRWLRHAGPHDDGFTFPDLVFPGFLLMVGMSIPLALRSHITHDVKPALGKIARRTLGLVAAGIMLVNEYRYAAEFAVLPKDVYYFLFYVAVILLWKDGRTSNLRIWLGALLLVALMLGFRGAIDADFSTGRLGHSWWGILGMIGWTYACCSLVYLAVQGGSTALMGVFAFMIALYMGGERGALDFLPHWFDGPIGIGQMFGSIAANVLAGTLVGNLFVETDQPPRQHMRRAMFIFVFALGVIVAGLLLRPYHPINKIQATETFTLICTGINLLAFLAFYVLMDVMRWRAWAAFLIPAGTNALFAYIVPDLWNYAMSLTGLHSAWSMVAWPCLEQGGTGGIVNAALVALLMLWLTAVANRIGLRLKL
jgi:heparan-alpha-glucosaminide N-acetyltransferase